MVKHSSSSQNSKFAMSLQYLTKRVTDEVHVDKHQSFIHVDFNTLGIKVSCKVILSLLLGMIKHSQSTQSNKFAISLYLYIFIFELIFCMQISINVSTSWDYCFGWKWSDMSKIPKIGSWWYSYNMLRKECHKGPVTFIVTCFLAHPDCKIFCLKTAVQ